MVSEELNVKQLEILRWLGEQTTSQWQRLMQPLSGSRAHWLLEKNFGSIEYAHFGVERFKDFLLPGDGKFYKVVLDGTRHALLPLNSTLPARPRESTARFLKPEVWAAFMRSAAHHFDRNTNSFCVGNAIDPARHIPVERIAEDIEKAWMLDFLSQKDSSHIENVRSLLPNPDWRWRIAGPSGLLSPAVSAAWRRYRFDRVVEEVRSWLQQHGLETELFSVPGPQSQPPDASRTASSESKHVDSFRDAILEALTRMSTAELARLPIPPVYFQPDQLTR